MTQLSHLKVVLYYWTGTQSLTQRGSMFSFPALLCSCVVSMLTLGHGIPLPPDLVKNFVKGQAENISSRIQKHKDEIMPMPPTQLIVLDSPELPLELPSDKPINGLGSIVETLSTFQRVLHSLPKGHVSQLRIDISTLQGYLEDRMRSLQCTHKKTVTKKNLEDFLNGNKQYHITVGQVALNRLQRYLQKLVHNLDQLKTC